MTEVLRDPEAFVGHRVLVTPNPDDSFTHDFEGLVIGVRNGFLKVRDAEDDVFDVEMSQVLVTDDE